MWPVYFTCISYYIVSGVQCHMNQLRCKEIKHHKSKDMRALEIIYSHSFELVYHQNVTDWYNKVSKNLNNFHRTFFLEQLMEKFSIIEQKFVTIRQKLPSVATARVSSVHSRFR
jgi:5'(3')-deoxyribonucleotidase